MSDILLKDKEGVEQTYTGIETVEFKTADGVAEFSEGGGETLPKLHAPTISVAEDNLSITNPATNGDFVDSYILYDGTDEVGTTTSNKLDLTTELTVVGDYNLSVKASGQNFINSDNSNSVAYSNTLYNVTNNLTNCATSNTSNKVRRKSNYSAIITANAGYELNVANITVTMGGVNVTTECYTQDGQTKGIINISNVNGDISISVEAQEISFVEWTNTANVKGEMGYADYYNGTWFVTLAYAGSKAINYSYTSNDGISWTQHNLGSNSIGENSNVAGGKYIKQYSCYNSNNG